MADIKYSVLTFDGDGSTLNWPINFTGGYLSKSHVKAYTLDAEGVAQDVTLEWVGDYTVKVMPAVPVGKTLTIYRDTPKDAPLVNFVDAGILGEAQLDLNAKQAVFIAAEYYDRFGNQLGWSQSIETLNARIAQEAYIREQADLIEAGMRQEISARLTVVEESASTDWGPTITALGAQITQEAVTRVTADEALSETIESVSASVASVQSSVDGLSSRTTATEAAVAAEATARATADASEAAARQAVSARVGVVEEDLGGLQSRTTAVEAAVVAESTARASADSAEATARQALEARLTVVEEGGADLTAVYAAISDEATARANADSAEAATRESVRAALQASINASDNTITQVQANVDAVNQARIDSDAAIASQLATVNANWQSENNNRYNEIQATNAAVSNEATARANADSALASDINSVSTTVGGHTASITSLTMSVNGLRAQWNVTTDVDGFVSGIYLTSTGASSDLKLKVSQFKITSPFGDITPFEVDTINNIVKMTNVYVAGTLTGGTLIEPERPAVTVPNEAKAAKVIPYMNDMNSNYSEFTGAQRYYKIADFYNNRTDVPFKQRIKSGDVEFTVSCAAAVDVRLSVWAQVLTSAGAVHQGMTWLAEGLDPAGGLGCVTVFCNPTLNVPVGGRVQFYMSVNNSDGTASSSTRSVETGTSLVTADNQG